MADEHSSEIAGEKPEHRPVIEHFPSVRRILRWLAQPDLIAAPLDESRPREGDHSADEPVDEATGPTAQHGHPARGASRPSLEDQHEFRPIMRPPTPVLTVLDDATRDEGEDYRLRGDAFTIGRTSGDVIIPHDQSISGTHARIQRTPWKGGFQWHLYDLDSVNGTFARCERAVLHENAIVILGARRFRLRNPLRSHVIATATAETKLMDGSQIPSTVWPVLMENSGKEFALQFPLRDDSVTIGRLGGGATIELDDPLLAYEHATLKRQRDGTWMITAKATRNGIWVSTSAIPLSAHCYFRCGEQRFRFVIP